MFHAPSKKRKRNLLDSTSLGNGPSSAFSIMIACYKILRWMVGHWKMEETPDSNSSTWPVDETVLVYSFVHLVQTYKILGDVVISKSDTSGQMGRTPQQTRHNFRKSDTHNQLVSRINGMAPCQIFTSLSLPHNHHPAITPASSRSNMLARRSPDGGKPAGKRPYGFVATPVKASQLGQGSPEVRSTTPHPMNALTLAQRKRLNRAQERGKPALLIDPPWKPLPKTLSEDARMTGSGSDRSFKGAEVEEQVFFVFSNVLQCARRVALTALTPTALTPPYQSRST
ncbi:hypothetical protein B0H11DRAFT_2331517 [Mycena galericulata]|nr:hypothetical protein B0H11DRAFT_2331517 [Mycena galericulata]